MDLVRVGNALVSPTAVAMIQPDEESGGSTVTLAGRGLPLKDDRPPHVLAGALGFRAVDRATAREDGQAMATLSYPLPQCWREHLLAVQSQDMHSAIVDFNEQLRRRRKHGDNQCSGEQMLETLWMCWREAIERVDLEL